MSGIREEIMRRKIVICAGCGGVGKTTTAAALAIAAAQRGRRVIVLTIDPAKRLANSLGLSTLDNEERQVERELFTQQGMPMEGTLHAMMLDTKRMFDHVIEKNASDPALAERILQNKIYQEVSTALAGSQEYMAMEKLWELSQEGRYDLIVLDTPPTKHALDFLDSPTRMLDFLDRGLMRVFMLPGQLTAKAGISLLKRGTDSAMAVIERLTGTDVLQALAEFFQIFDGMYEGFQERARGVQSLLRSPDTLFYLITAPTGSNVDEALYFYDKIREYTMPFGGFVVNRTHPTLAGGNEELKALLERLSESTYSPAAALPEDTRGEWGPLLEKMTGVLRDQEALATGDRAQLARMEATTAPLIRKVPFFETDIYDIRGLDRINEYLMHDKP